MHGIGFHRRKRNATGQIIASYHSGKGRYRQARSCPGIWLARFLRIGPAIFRRLPKKQNNLQGIALSNKNDS
jgi:hypothetical protein